MIESNCIGDEEIQTIRTLANDFDKAWNARDAKLFSTFFTMDGDMHFITLNMRMQGRDEVTRAYTKIFSEMAPEIKHKTTAKEIHVLTHDVVLLDTTTDIMTLDAQGQEKILRRHTAAGILLKTEEGWRIRASRIWSEQISAA
ncbi:MAG: SgcJ/EcaC family oxidoreductase [candidate division WOR-3 bacterium]|nr:SgcJ/EcaC family oxidoreductase [candidate division WOR-3 bacterium]